MNSLSSRSPRRLRRGAVAGVAALVASLAGWIAPAVAIGAQAGKTVRYHGYRLEVPASWPVYRLAANGTECVRFDRHAVYLGRPSADQSCPAHAAGRTEAVLIEPFSARSSATGGAGGAGVLGGATGPVLAAPSRAGAAPGSGSTARIVDTADSVIVTATWSRQPALIERALHLRSLAALLAAASRQGPPRSAVAAATGHVRPAVQARAASVPAQAGQVYTGLGFDGCSTPTAAQMAAWTGTSYDAIGVYIGGTNEACSQSNLTAAWVSQQSEAGWHLIPIYVGLQAPGNSCGCGAIVAGTAASQGTAAAQDAITQAQALGLGAGNPIYYDMEAYTPGSTVTPAVLAFLASWTTQLHAEGYKSGVYSSADSGIIDLVSQVGTSYPEPDDIWIARWNEVKNTADPDVPSADWASHQRLHQYDGGHNETHGGVTFNIDGDYLDGATAAAGSGTPIVATLPSLSVSPSADGGIDLRPSWSGAAGISSWQVIAGATPDAMSAAANPISASAGAPIVMRSAFAYFAVQALGAEGQTLGTSPPVATPSHVAIFGQSAFVPGRGISAVPVGCFNPIPCHVTTRISVGRTVLSTTNPERVPVGGGLVYFTLSPGGRAKLARAPHRRLPVTITVQDVSGVRATRQLNLVSFTTSGRSPRRSITQAAALRVIGTTDFVSNGWTGGILVACYATTPCNTTTTIVSGRTTVAHTTPQSLGVNELGYLIFAVTPAGHKLLTHASGNQLPVTLTISTGSAIATGRIVLASF